MDKKEIILEFFKNDKYREFLSKNLKTIPIIPYNNIKDIKEKVKEILNDNTILQNDCFYTAYKLCIDIKDVNYIEGFFLLTDKIPMHHAWNSYKDFYFDLTNELILKNNITEYYQVLFLNKLDVLKTALKCNSFGCFLYYPDRFY